MSIHSNFSDSISLRWSILLLAFICSNFSFAQTDFAPVKDLIKSKKYEEAKTSLTTLLSEISEADSSDYIEANSLLATVQYRGRDFQKSIDTYGKLLEYLPETSAKKGDFLFKAGNAYLRLGDYENYLTFNKRAAEAYEQTVGKNSAQYTKVLNSIGFGHQLKGAYKDSEKTLLEARKIKERNKVYDIQYSRILNQLGKSYTVLNKFQEAEECILTSLNIKEGLKGKNRDYAKTLFSYSILLQTVGRSEEAIEKIDEAIEIAEKSGMTADILMNKQVKAGHLAENQMYQEASKLYEEVMAGRMKAGEEESTNYAKILFDLSDLYLKSKDSDKALKYAEDAFKLFEKIHGKEHPYYAMAIRNKADILLEQGKTSGIENYYKTSSKIIARKYSKKHIEYFKSEYAYFLFLKKTKNYSAAIKKIDRLDDIITNYIIDASKYLSIQEIIEITNLYHDYFQEILSLTSLNPDNQVLSEKAFDCSLFYKGYILEALLSIKKAIKSSKEITDLSETLTELKLKLSGELDKSDKNSSLIEELQDKVDRVEIDIAWNLGKLRKEDDRLSWDAIQYELSSDEAAIDFVRFSNEEKDDFLYGAMILLPDADAPRFITLFLESDLTKHFEGKLTESNILIARLYNAGDRGAIAARQEDVSLYELIWKKIAPELDGISKVYYICDGVLHNLALHAIPTDLEFVVSDSVQLLQMTSFKNLIRTKSGSYSEKLKKALLIGGVKYGELPKEGGNRGNRKAWKDLPWTEREVNEISQTLKAKEYNCEVLKASEPNKNTLKQKLTAEDKPNILHFATHGYFATDDLLQIKSSVNTNQTNLELTNSALVLANANELEKKDALLSAFEISEMDLSTTDLVVLSACETGLGQVYEHEGVYGMQRAFKIAGADYIIMSLWQVPDRETKVFMTDFYKNHMEEGLSIPDAFYKTQRKLKETLFDPLKWAGFVLLQ